MRRTTPATAASYSDTVQTFCQSPRHPARARRPKTLYAQTLNRFKQYTLRFTSRPDVNTHARPEVIKQPKDVAPIQLPIASKKNSGLSSSTSFFLSIIQKRLPTLRTK